MASAATPHAHQGGQFQYNGALISADTNVVPCNVDAGRTFIVFSTIENTGAGDATDVSIEMVTDFGFDTVGGTWKVLAGKKIIRTNSMTVPTCQPAGQIPCPPSVSEYSIISSH